MAVNQSMTCLADHSHPSVSSRTTTATKLKSGTTLGSFVKKAKPVLFERGGSLIKLKKVYSELSLRKDLRLSLARFGDTWVWTVCMRFYEGDPHSGSVNRVLGPVVVQHFSPSPSPVAISGLNFGEGQRSGSNWLGCWNLVVDKFQILNRFWISKAHCNPLTQQRRERLESLRS